MFGIVQTWFIVEVASITHDFSHQGGSLPFFTSTIEQEPFYSWRTMHL